MTKYVGVGLVVAVLVGALWLHSRDRALMERARATWADSTKGAVVRAADSATSATVAVHTAHIATYKRTAAHLEHTRASIPASPLKALDDTLLATKDSIIGAQFLIISAQAARIVRDSVDNVRLALSVVHWQREARPGLVKRLWRDLPELVIANVAGRLRLP